MSTTDIIEKTEGADEVTKTRKRTVKPIKKFPSHSIEEALKIPTLIKENNGGNPWATEQLARALNMKKGGNNFYYLTASSRDYGFTNGTRETVNVELMILVENTYMLNPKRICWRLFGLHSTILRFLRKCMNIIKGTNPLMRLFLEML